jgi:hypothetical protein
MVAHNRLPIVFVARQITALHFPAQSFELSIINYYSRPATGAVIKNERVSSLRTAKTIYIWRLKVSALCGDQIIGP